jgi:hypothetical protein
MSYESLKREMNSNVRFFLALVFKGSKGNSRTELLLEGRKSLRRLILERNGVDLCLGTINGKGYKKKNKKRINL